MSLDDVDIIHAAEDYAESLRLKARRVITTRDEVAEASSLHPFDATRWMQAFLQHQDAMLMLDIGSKDQFVRPGCEDGECDEWCGGYHPPKIDEDGTPLGDCDFDITLHRFAHPKSPDCADWLPMDVKGEVIT